MSRRTLNVPAKTAKRRQPDLIDTVADADVCAPLAGPLVAPGSVADGMLGQRHLLAEVVVGAARRAAQHVPLRRGDALVVHGDDAVAGLKTSVTCGVRMWWFWKCELVSGGG